MSGKNTSLFNKHNVRLTLQFLTLVIVALGLSLILVSVQRSVKADTEIRRTIEATPERVMGGPGESGALVVGKFIENYSAFAITYDLKYSLQMSPIQSLIVRGPMRADNFTGPVFFSLCGLPGTTVCDTQTTPGRLTQTVRTLEPNGDAALAKMREIRADPDRYYLEVLTTAVPNEPGAARSPLHFSMGPDL